MQRRFFIILMLVASCSNRNSSKNTAYEQSSPSRRQNIQASAEVFVTTLPTADETQEDSFVKNFQYPASITVDNIDTFINSIGAYGAAYEVWIGPRGWTGRGVIIADGNISVSLYPQGDFADAGPHFSYTEIPTCQPCIVTAAAPFFADAMKQYNIGQGSGALKIPPGLHINTVSPSLITYTLPAKNGLLSQGVVYFTANGDEKYFASAEFVLPANRQQLADFMTNQFVLSRKLN